MTYSWPGAGGMAQLPFRRLFRRLERPVPFSPEIVTAYTDGQVTARSNRSKERYHEAADLSSYQGVEIGDFVVHGLDIMRGSVGVSDSRGAMSAVCTVCEPTELADPRYMAYAMRLMAESDYPKALARGVRDGGADFRRWDTLASLPLPAPPVSQQRAIAEFLDRETAKIDALIEKQTSLVGMLDQRLQNELDTALIDGPWDADPLKLSWLFSFFNGDRGASYPSRDDFVSEGVPFINAGHLSKGRVQRDGMNYITRDQFFQMGGAKLRAGDVLFCLRGSLGKFAVFDWCGSAGALASSLVALRRISPRVDLDYFSLVLRSTQFSEQVGLAQTGSAQPNLAVEDLRQFRIDLPPITAQRAIAARFAEQSAQTTRLRDVASRHIALAQERRSALITAAVTGQLEIPAA